MMKSRLATVIKFLFAVLVLYILVATDLLEPDAVITAVRQRPGYLLLAVAVYFVITLIAGIRWILLMKAVGLSISLSRAFSLHMIGLFFSMLLPGGAGGDLAKGYYLFRHQQPGRRALALTSIAMDRVIGIYGLFITGVIVILLNFDLAMSSNYLRLNALFYLSLFAVAATIALLLLSPLRTRVPGLFKPRKFPGTRVLTALADSVQAYTNRKRDLAIALLLSIMVHGGLTLVFYLILLALDLNLRYLDNAFVVPLMTLINSIPFSPGGLGISEAAGEFLYRIMGLGDSGSEILTLFHVCLATASLVGLPFYLLYRTKDESTCANVDKQQNRV